MIIFRKGGTIKRVVGVGGGGGGRIKIHAKVDDRKKMCSKDEVKKKSRRVNYIAGLTNCTRLNGSHFSTAALISWCWWNPH